MIKIIDYEWWCKLGSVDEIRRRIIYSIALMPVSFQCAECATSRGRGCRTTWPTCMPRGHTAADPQLQPPRRRRRRRQRLEPALQSLLLLTSSRVDLDIVMYMLRLKSHVSPRIKPTSYWHHVHWSDVRSMHMMSIWCCLDVMLEPLPNLISKLLK